MDKAAPIAKPRVELLRLSDVKAERLSWLWPGRLPLGKVSMLVGDPSLGKSMLTVDFAARVSNGWGWPDNRDRKQPVGDVVLMSAEDSVSDTLKPRLMAAGANCTRVHTIKMVRNAEGKETGFCLADVETLRLVAKAIPELRLVCIDPVSAYLGGVDSHNNAEIRSLLAPLADFAEENGIAVVCVTHSNKSTAQKAMYRIVGSLAFVAAARACWAIVRDPKDPDRRGFLPVKNNLGKDAGGLAYNIGVCKVEGLGSQPHIVWHSDSLNVTADEWMQQEAALTGSETDTTVEWLKEFLADGSQRTESVREGARQAGLAWAAVRSAKDKLGVLARKKGAAGSAGYWVWLLPPQN